MSLSKCLQEERRRGAEKKSGTYLSTPSLQSTPLWYFCYHRPLFKETLPKKKCFIGFSGKGNWAKNKFHIDLHSHAKVWSLMSCCKISLKTVLVTVPRTPISQITAMSHALDLEFSLEMRVRDNDHSFPHTVASRSNPTVTSYPTWTCK